MVAAPQPPAGPLVPGEVCLDESGALELPPLHASEAKLLLACPRKWHFSHVHRRVPRERSAALSRGSLVHAWLAAWWAGIPQPPLPEEPIARACCLGYASYYGEPIPSPRGWATEARFQTELGGVGVAGTVDAIDGDTIVEHKTASEDISPGSVYWRRVVTTDLQVSLYRAAFPGSKIIYDVIRKPALRGKQGESADSLVARCLAAMTDEPEKYFARAVVVRLEGEDEAFARDIVDVDRLRRRGPWPRNPSSCFDYGTRCGFYGVCWEHERLDDDSLFQDQEEGR